MSEWKISPHRLTPPPPPSYCSKRSAASGIICPRNIMHSLLRLITYLLRNLLRFGSTQIW